ncbi:MAG: Hpt domain-containing protein [Aestuariibacter sp.]
MAQDSNVIFDREFALNQLSGNAELLQKMLERFCNDYAGMADEVKTVIESADFAEVRRKAHTIKGVAGNLGFWNLHLQAKLLEDAAKQDGADLSAAYHDFNTSLLASMDEIRADGKLDTGSSEQTASDKPARDVLHDLLNAFEFIEPEKLDQLLDESGIDSTKKTDIINAVNDLDYPAALSLLENN